MCQESVVYAVCGLYYKMFIYIHHSLPLYCEHHIYTLINIEPEDLQQQWKQYREKEFGFGEDLILQSASDV
jgi:hypothetical protein